MESNRKGFEMSVSAPPQGVATSRGEGRIIRFYADEMEVKLQSGGVDVVETIAHAGCEPPLHVHENEDETFYIVEGEVTFYAGETVLRAGPGTHVYAPRGIAHTYAVESGVARMIVTASGKHGFLETFGIGVPEETGNGMRGQ